MSVSPAVIKMKLDSTGAVVVDKEEKKVESKICPILSLVYGTDVYCRKEKCAWYLENSKECVIKLFPYIINPPKINYESYYGYTGTGNLEKTTGNIEKTE